MQNTDTFSSRHDGPRIERVRHETKFRTLRVDDVTRLTPGMLRLTFSGDDLADFVSLGFDDHVKVLSPTALGEVARRDYTPRRYDRRARLLTIDFAVHEAGPATSWALGARRGDEIKVGGPKGSAVVAPEVRRWLLVGDEAALPAIGRRIEEAEAGTRIISVVAVSGPEEHQSFETEAQLIAHWTHRPLATANDASALLAAVDNIDLEPDTFAWVAAEASVARAVRDHLVHAKNHPPAWIKAAGYWKMGEADAHERVG